MQFFQQITPIPIPTPTPPVAVTPLPAATAVPGSPPAAAVATAVNASTTGTQPIGAAAVLALVIYLAFFGVIGHRRGTRRELIVLVVALGMFFILQQFSSFFVSLADKFGKGWAFLLGQPIPETSGLGAWASANTATYLLSIWLITVVITYLLTNRFVKKSKKDGWAFLAGVANGLVFATIFAPLLTTLIFPGTTIEAPVSNLRILTFVSNIWQQLVDIFVRIWAAIEPYASAVFFLAVVILILFAAFTLRTSAKAK